MKNSVFKTILSVCIILIFGNYSRAQESPAEVLRSLTPEESSFFGGYEWEKVNSLQTSENLFVLNVENQYGEKRKITFGLRGLSKVKEYSFYDTSVIELIYTDDDSVMNRGDNDSSSSGKLSLIYNINDHQKALKAFKNITKSK